MHGARHISFKYNPFAFFACFRLSSRAREYWYSNSIASEPFNLVRDGVIRIFVVEVDFRYSGADKLLDYLFSLAE